MPPGAAKSAMDPIVGFILNDNEKQDLMAFLNSLTDEEFLKNPELSDPYKDTTD